MHRLLAELRVPAIAFRKTYATALKIAQSQFPQHINLVTIAKAFAWKPGSAERLIKRYSLPPLSNTFLPMRGFQRQAIILSSRQHVVGAFDTDKECEQLADSLIKDDVPPAYPQMAAPQQSHQQVHISAPCASPFDQDD